MSADPEATPSKPERPDSSDEVSEQAENPSTAGRPVPDEQGEQEPTLFEQMGDTTRFSLASIGNQPDTWELANPGARPRGQPPHVVGDLHE